MFILTINEYCQCLCFLPCCLQTKNKNRGKNEKLLFKCLGLRNVLGRPDLEECLAGCESDNF